MGNDHYETNEISKNCKKNTYVDIGNERVKFLLLWIKDECCCFTVYMPSHAKGFLHPLGPIVYLYSIIVCLVHETVISFCLCLGSTT